MAHVAGERAPKVDRPEALVKEHERRTSFGAGRGLVDPHLEFAGADDRPQVGGHDLWRRT